MRRSLTLALLAASLFTSCAEENPQCKNTDFYEEDTTVSPILTKTCEEAGATPIRLTKDFLSLADFPKRLVVGNSGARFRRSPEFNVSNIENVLGFVAAKNEIYASGPRKSESGIYYIIPALDVNNEICLAYVSSSVVTEKPHPASEGGPLP